MNVNAKSITLTNGAVIHMVVVENLNLYIISDVTNFGNHWIQVTRKAANVFDTKTLFGSNGLSLEPVVRFFADKLLKRSTQSAVGDVIEGQSVLFNVSLRDQSKDVIKQIAEHL